MQYRHTKADSEQIRQYKVSSVPERDQIRSVNEGFIFVAQQAYTWTCILTKTHIGQMYAPNPYKKHIYSSIMSHGAHTSDRRKYEEVSAKGSSTREVSNMTIIENHVITC